MQTPREWRRYYKESRVVDFQDHALAYCAVAEVLREKFPDIFRLVDRPTYILGGYHPRSRTPEAFKRFCRTLSADCQMVLVDQNTFPLASYKDPDLQVRVQASLEEWVEQRPRWSIDGLVLDCTVEFMDDRQLARMARGLKTSLNPNGIVWLVNHRPILKGLEGFLRTVQFGIRSYLRNPEDVLGLVSGSLKPIVSCGFETHTSIGGKDQAYLLALASVSSPLPKGGDWYYLPIEP